MKWIDRLAARFGYVRRQNAVMRVLSEKVETGFWAPYALAEGQERAYIQSVWVHVAVSLVAQTAASARLGVYRVEGDAEIPVDDHPVMRLLERPNPLTSRFDLLEGTFGYLELTGNAYWYLAGPPGGAPTEIWLLRPDRIRPVAGRDRPIGGWLYNVEGEEIPLSADEVLHFKRWHPQSDLYGLGVIEAIALEITGDLEAARWNREFFGSSAVPAGMLVLPGLVSDAEFERVKAEWERRHRGGRRTAIVKGDGVQWYEIGLSQREMDFLAGRQLSRQAIFEAFGVPTGLLSERSTEAHARVAERQFLRGIYHRHVRHAQQLQPLLDFWPGRYVFRYEDVRQGDAEQLKAQIEAERGLVTINEIRTRHLGLPPVPWGDVPAGAQDSEITR